jgi:hypothetical protein
MAGHRIRALAGVVLAGASLALAACTSGSSHSQGQSAAQAVGVPVKDGTVVVRQGNKVICTMKVVNGKGTCQVPAKSLGVGTSQIVGTYSGNGYSGSGSAPVNVTVVQATTSPTLTLSPATVTYGQEQAERLSVKVTALHGGTPTGTVAVKSNGATVCLITLSGAVGTCTLPAGKLSVGTHALIADYPGDHWYDGSASAAVKLTVIK